MLHKAHLEKEPDVFDVLDSTKHKSAQDKATNQGQHQGR